MFHAPYPRAFVLLAALAVLAAGAGRLAAEETATQRVARRAEQWQKQIQPLMAKYCYDCHGGAKTEADLSLVDFKTPEQILKERKRWNVLLQKVETGAMPLVSSVLVASLSYRMSEKWIATGGTAIDFANTGNIGQTLTMTRVGESFLVRLGLNVDASRNNVGFVLGIEPRFLPGSRLGRVGGVQIPPAGALGLE